MAQLPRAKFNDIKRAARHETGKSSKSDLSEYVSDSINLTVES